MRTYALLNPEKTIVVEIIPWPYDGTAGQPSLSIYDTFSKELGPRIVLANASVEPGWLFTPPDSFTPPPPVPDPEDELPKMFAAPAGLPSELDFQALLYTLDFPFSQRKFTWGEFLALFTPEELDTLSAVRWYAHNSQTSDTYRSHFFGRVVDAIHEVCCLDGGIHLYHPLVVKLATGQYAYTSATQYYVLGALNSNVKLNKELTPRIKQRMAEFLSGNTSAVAAACEVSLSGARAYLGDGVTGVDLRGYTPPSTYAPASFAVARTAVMSLMSAPQDNEPVMSALAPEPDQGVEPVVSPVADIPDDKPVSE